MATRTKRTPDQLVRALLEKTVRRGATPGEQDAAVEKARALCARHGLDPTGFEWPPERIAVQLRIPAIVIAQSGGS